MSQKQQHAGAMAGQPGPAEISALNSLRQKLLPLVYQLENMKNEMANPVKPPDWPTIQRSIANVNTLVASIQSLLNDDPETTKIFASLHPYPISPYPINDPLLGNIAGTHLRKALEVHDQDWVSDRLAKASEFAHVPEEWGIEPRKPKDHSDDADGGDGVDGLATRRIKRIKGGLNEDELAGLWAQSAGIVMEEMERVEPQTGSGEEDDEEEEEDEDEDMEEVGGKDGENAVKARGVVLPVMPLEVLHKFMMTGAVVESQFQSPA